MSDRPKCQGETSESGTGFYRKYPCGRNASVEREGHHYCGIHDPVAVESRRVKRNAKSKAAWDARSAEWNRKHLMERSHSALLAACKMAMRELEASGLCFDHPDINELRAAIALAEGKDVTP